MKVAPNRRFFVKFSAVDSSIWSILTFELSILFERFSEAATSWSWLIRPFNCWSKSGFLTLLWYLPFLHPPFIHFRFASFSRLLPQIQFHKVSDESFSVLELSGTGSQEGEFTIFLLSLPRVRYQQRSSMLLQLKLSLSAKSRAHWQSCRSHIPCLSLCFSNYLSPSSWHWVSFVIFRCQCGVSTLVRTTQGTSYEPYYPQCMYCRLLDLSFVKCSSFCSDYFRWHTSLGSISLGWYDRYLREAPRESILLNLRLLFPSSSLLVRTQRCNSDVFLSSHLDADSSCVEIGSNVFGDVVVKNFAFSLNLSFIIVLAMFSFDATFLSCELIDAFSCVFF